VELEGTMPHSADQRSRGEGRRILGTAGTGHSTFIVGKGKGAPEEKVPLRNRVEPMTSAGRDGYVLDEQYDSAAPYGCRLLLLEHKVTCSS